MSRQALIEECRRLEGSISALTPAQTARLHGIVRELRRCLCRQCGKEYAEGRSRAEYTGFCSAKCQHAKARQLGYRPGNGPSEYICLRVGGAVGSMFVIQ